MPRRVIMRLRNKQFILSLIVLFLFTVAGRAQNTTPPEAPPRSSQRASPSAPPTAAPQSSPQQPPAGQEPGNDSGTFVFHSDVQEVLLHATVIDDKQRMVTSLDQNAFTVF